MTEVAEAAEAAPTQAAPSASTQAAQAEPATRAGWNRAHLEQWLRELGWTPDLFEIVDEQVRQMHFDGIWPDERGVCSFADLPHRQPHQ